MIVTHAEPSDKQIGGTVEEWEWRLGEGVLIDRGRVAHVDPDDYWNWHLVQCDGVYYVGLPGLENFRTITFDQAHNRAQLDAEIGDLLISHGI